MNSPRSILVVDDAESDRSFLKAVLNSIGYEAELARDGFEALDKLNSNIDLVLLDALIPELDGFEIARRIRDRADCGDVPIVMVTVLTGKEDRLRAIAAGANDFLSKPIDKTELQVRIASLLKMKDARDALRHSEERYRTLVETAQDVIWTVDLDFRYTYVSPSIKRALGYTVDEFMSMNPLDGLTPTSRERVITAFKEATAAPPAPAGERNSHRIEELERYHKDGSTRWAEVTVSLLRDGDGKSVGIMGISHDVTERKRMEDAVRRARDDFEQRVEERTAELSRANEQLRLEIADRRKAEEALKESEERYRALFEYAAEGILAADLETRSLRYANPAVCRMFGYTLEEILQLKVSDIHPPESSQQVAADFEALGRGENIRVSNITGLRKDGSLFFADIVAAPLVIDKRRMAVGLFTDITERKNMEDSLRRSEERFRSLIDQAADSIFVHDFDGRFLEVNRHACTSLGYTRDEMLSMSVADVDPDAVPRGDSANFWSSLPVTFEARHRRKDGTIYPVEIRLGAIQYEDSRVVLAMARDLTDRKMAEEALRESEERFRQVAESAGEWIWEVDASGVYRYCSSAVENIIGYSPDELVGKKHFYDLFTPEVREDMMQKAMAAFERRQTFRCFANPNIHKNGHTVILETSGSPIIDRQGNLIGYRGADTDITERKRIEREKESLKEQLFQAQKMETIGTLAGGIAHDFNNLLTVINGFAEVLLMDTAEDDPRHGDLLKVLETGRKGADLVQRLLTFSRKAEVNLIPLDINLIVENSVKLMKRTFPGMIEIETTLEHGLGPASADASLVEQVLMNLCINAKEAMPQGGGLKIVTRTVTVDKDLCRLHPEMKPGHFVCIDVEDTGKGMDKETVDRVFDPFFTSKGWDFRKGTGLGLSVAKGIVDQHGGWITCSSEPGMGSTFRVCLPVAKERKETRTEPTTASVPHGRYILLVDDEGYVRDLGKRILERSGYTVITAEDGKQALEIYSREKSNIGLVVLDLIMPRMGGEKCLEELLKINPHLKVIVSTGQPLDARDRLRLTASAKGFVNKPYQVGQLAQTVKSVLEEQG